jgi:hypothetical protein
MLMSVVIPELNVPIGAQDGRLDSVCNNKATFSPTSLSRGLGSVNALDQAQHSPPSLLLNSLTIE